MDFSPQQSEAIDSVGQWLKHKDKPYFYLAGFAGTGKTTLAKHLAAGAGRTQFAAFTGKAASVLNRKGCPAATIHSMIYQVIPEDEDAVRDLLQKMEKETNPHEHARMVVDLKKLQQPKFELNPDSIVAESDLIIIDEVSMVGEEMGKDLLSYGTPVLVLGDPGQLPPIDGAGFFTSGKPDFFLSEIHRQARDNPIINLATMARQGRRLPPGHYGDSRVYRRHQRTDEMLVDASQILCGRNATRSQLNALVRDRRNYVGPVPLEEEKLICLRNANKEGLLNGTQWEVAQGWDRGTHLELNLWPMDPVKEPEDPTRVLAHHFDVDLASMPFYDRKRFQEFTWGYAITCHKSQGSQWPHVFIQDESWCFRENSSKWLYTALTRAETKVTVVL